MKKYLDMMRHLKGEGSDVTKWPIAGWYQPFFSDMVKCDVIDNNMPETFNGVLIDAKSKPIITMLEDIRQYVITGVVVKREFASKWQVICGPNIVAKLEKERKKSSMWQVEWNGGLIHEVFWDNLVLHVREGYVVKLQGQACSCGKWDKSGLPYQHALVAMSFDGLDSLDYVFDWFKKERYLHAYELTVNPVKGRTFWPNSAEGPLLAL